MRDLVRIKCCIVLQKLNYHHISSPTLLAPGRYISGYPTASGYRIAPIQIPPCRFFFVAALLSSYLMHFLARLVNRIYFRLKGLVDLTVDLAIGVAVSMARKVAVSLSGLSF